MLHIFLELVKRVGIFVIIGQTILHFGISKEYEKYMKLVISLMVVAQIVFAFDSYLQKQKREFWMISSEEYYEQWEMNMDNMEQEFEERQSQITQNLEHRFQQKEIKTDKKNTEKQSRQDVIKDVKIETIIMEE